VSVVPSFNLHPISSASVVLHIGKEFVVNDSYIVETDPGLMYYASKIISMQWKSSHLFPLGSFVRSTWRSVFSETLDEPRKSIVIAESVGIALA
jgi:hypothetical protein